jgi:hypothetical protein
VIPGEALALIGQALGQQGFVVLDDTEPQSLAGTIEVNGRPVRLIIRFPCLRFSRLPQVLLSHRAEDIPEAVAHVEAGDFICYATAGSLILDQHRPGESALAVIREAKNTLERSLSATAGTEIGAEFPQHWRAAADVHMALPPDAAEGMASILMLPRLGTALPLSVLTRSLPQGGFEGGAMGVLRSPSAGRAWIGRVACDLRLPAGHPPAHFSEFLDWMEAHDPGLRARLLRAAAEKFFSEPVWLFVLAPNGCVGVRLVLPLLWERAVRTRGFWAARMRGGAAHIGLVRLRGERMDAVHARTRNLPGKATLAGKLVALVGCGAIGSHLARLLTQMGAGQGGGRLLLFDEDVLSAGNLGRHWLGAAHIGNGKAAAVEAELKRLSPGLAVQAIGDDAMRRLDTLCRTDLLVDATGEEALSRALNHEVLLRRPGGPAMIFAWLLGQGAAAQALFMPASQDGRGCYACARPFGLLPAAMRDDAPMLPAPAACGEAEFMPYGVASPVLAAGLAAAMALEWANDDVRPSLRTIRIDHGATRDEPNRDVPSVAGCPDCGTARG